MTDKLLKRIYELLQRLVEFLVRQSGDLLSELMRQQMSELASHVPDRLRFPGAAVSLERPGGSALSYRMRQTTDLKIEKRRQIYDDLVAFLEKNDNPPQQLEYVEGSGWRRAGSRRGRRTGS